MTRQVSPASRQVMESSPTHPADKLTVPAAAKDNVERASNGLGSTVHNSIERHLSAISPRKATGATAAAIAKQKKEFLERRRSGSAPKPVHQEVLLATKSTVQQGADKGNDDNKDALAQSHHHRRHQQSTYPPLSASGAAATVATPIGIGIATNHVGSS